MSYIPWRRLKDISSFIAMLSLIILQPSFLTTPDQSNKSEHGKVQPESKKKLEV